MLEKIKNDWNLEAYWKYTSSTGDMYQLVFYYIDTLDNVKYNVLMYRECSDTWDAVRGMSSFANIKWNEVELFAKMLVNEIEVKYGCV